MTTIRTITNMGQAAFLISVLQGNGFDAELLDEGSFQYAAVMVPMRIQVPEEQAAEAMTFLNTVPEAKPDFSYPENDEDEPLTA